jgi:hypothetical protein
MDLMKQFTKVANTADRYLVEIEFQERVLAGQPLQKDMIRAMVKNQLVQKAKKEMRRGLSKDEQRKVIEETVTDEMIDDLSTQQMDELFGGKNANEVIISEERARSNVFKSDHEGPYLGTYQMKACLNDCITTLGITMAKRGSKQTVQHATVVKACDKKGNIYRGGKGNRLHFHDLDWKVVDEPDGIVEICGHVTDANGPRSILKGAEYTEGRRTRFIVMVQELEDSRRKARLDDKDICRVLNAAQHNAVGAVRKLGFGKFDIIRLEKL